MQIDDIVNKVFTRSFMGYDMREVDCFLDDIIDKLERYESERREMLTAMEYLLDKLEHGEALPEKKQALPEAGSEKIRRSHGPRLIRAPKKKQAEIPAAPLEEPVDLAAEAEVAVELELGPESPNVDALFPELLEALADMDIPLGSDAGGEEPKDDA